MQPRAGVAIGPRYRKSRHVMRRWPGQFPPEREFPRLRRRATVTAGLFAASQSRTTRSDIWRFGPASVYSWKKGTDSVCTETHALKYSSCVLYSETFKITM